MSLTHILFLKPAKAMLASKIKPSFSSKVILAKPHSFDGLQT
jgi:hypothetical protein